MSAINEALDALAVLNPLVWLKRHTPAAVPSKYAPFHRQLIPLPEPGESQARVVYRGAAKTTITRGTVLHAAIHRKVRGILLIRATLSDGKADREALERNARLAGVEAVNDGSQNMVLVGDVPIWVRTPGSSVRGIHWVNPATGEVVRPELIVIDDLETRATARSKEQTKVIQTWLFSDALQVGGQGVPTRVIMLGTPITPTSLIAKAMRREAPFDTWLPPVIVPITDAAGNPNWPDNYDAGVRARVPELTMATEYDLDPLPPGTLLFPPKRTRWVKIPATAAHEVIVAIDPAGDGEDATAAVAMCLTPRGLHVIDCYHHTGSATNAPAMIGKFVRDLQAEGWLVAGITFEGVGAWVFMKREVAAQVAPIRVQSEAPTESKVERALPLTLWHQQGALSADPRLQGSVWDTEFHTFTQDGSTTSGHDDCLDATAWAAPPLTRGWRIDPPKAA